MSRILAILVSIGLLLYGCGNERDPLFISVASPESGITFVNAIVESDSLNILNNEFVYNGAGVAIADLNGDLLPDIFLAGNQVDNRLYINRGDLTFEDVTDAAGVGKSDPLMWSSGVNIVDVNADGRRDIYICNTLRDASRHRRNLLYINQGTDDVGSPIFNEMGEAYGIGDTSHSSHAQFFDYDNDGDLDLFVGVNLIEDEYPNQFVELVKDGSAPNRDNLFENRWDSTVNHPVFVDVSIQAGILQDGYSHSTLIYDFNEDGWQDIYVANDYESNDLIFINNQNGTFTNRAGDVFKHFSLSAMGSDVGDINNDGRADFVTSEMQPYYNKRKKLFQGESSYQSQILTRQYDYTYQYTRNTLQLNLGTNPETGLPIFGDIGMHANVQETDWSWATLFADYDHDGWQDLFIVNGFPRDVTDRDFADFRAYASRLVTEQELLAAIPAVKSPNFMFRNTGELRFEEVSEEWGFSHGSFTNGAAYGDLDLDGDLDLVLNNIDDPVLLMKNTLSDRGQNTKHFVRIKLEGPRSNIDALGALVTLYAGDWIQRSTVLSGRGYLSMCEPVLHFGLGELKKIDSLHILWPGGHFQVVRDLEVDTLHTLRLGVAADRPESDQNPSMFSNITPTSAIQLVDSDIDFVDFNFQRTLPHKFSQFGPALAVGDINGDNLDDLFVGSSRGSVHSWFVQGPGGTFTKKEEMFKTSKDGYEEDAGILLFDADGDGDLDLYVVRGSAQYPADDPLYQDVLLVNDGSGNFTYSRGALPMVRSNGSCVKAADYDRDGDLDLFVGSRVKPRSYPYPDRSMVLRNESTTAKISFVDATEEVNGTLSFIGLVSDALWTDVNADHWPDLIVVGEWMAPRIFINEEGILHDETDAAGLDKYLGWWTSVAGADLDNDGDTDYILGNYGENIYFQCSGDEPLKVYGKDLDNNGSIDPLISCYWRDSVGRRAEYLYHPRQDVIKQFVGIRKKYNTFAEFGESTVPEMFADGVMDSALVKEATWMKSSWIENLGDGRMSLHAFPVEMQLAPIFATIPYDCDGDGWLDIIAVGNDFGMEVQQGRADAFVGLVLRNEGGGFFDAIDLEKSGWVVPGDAKSLVRIKSQDSMLVVASQNRGPLLTYICNGDMNTMAGVPQDAIYSLTNTPDGGVRRQEYYWGSTFQSQSGRYYNPYSGNTSFFDFQGNKIKGLPVE